MATSASTTTSAAAALCERLQRFSVIVERLLTLHVNFLKIFLDFSNHIERKVLFYIKCSF
jgi:hypothetical protein